MNCRYPRWIGNRWVPCNKCILCKIAHTKEWAIRIEDEAKYYKEKCIITLTYNPDSLPWPGSLEPEDATLFLKRLRSHAAKTVMDNKKVRIYKDIKYIYCGEYGSQHDRPHYHAIILGWQPDDGLFLKITKAGTILYTSETLNKIWGMGWCVYSGVNPTGIKYTLKYIHKIYTQKMEKNIYKDLEPPFLRCSKGIGLKEIEKNINKLYDDNGIIVNNGNKKYKRGLPRYYLKKMREILLDETYGMDELNKKYQEPVETVPTDNTIKIENIISKTRTERNRR